MAETKLTTTTETEPKGVMRTMTTGKNGRVRWKTVFTIS